MENPFSAQGMQVQGSECTGSYSNPWTRDQAQHPLRAEVECILLPNSYRKPIPEGSAERHLRAIASIYFFHFQGSSQRTAEGEWQMASRLMSIGRRVGQLLLEFIAHLSTRLSRLRSSLVLLSELVL